jgi:ATP-binding cassette subfamily B protein
MAPARGVGAAGVIAVVAPEVWPWLLALVVVAGAGPVLVVRRATEADLRVRTLSGSLARFYSDAVLGADVLRAAGPVAAAALRHEHDRSLRAWAHAQRRLALLSAATRGGVGALAAAATVGAVVATDGGVATVLLVAVMGSLLVDGAGLVADALRTLPVARSTVARATGAIMTAPAPGAARLMWRPPGLVLDKLTVATGGVVQLDALDLCVPAGAHVAVLGASGAGKSTLLAVLLGWAEPTGGRILVDGAVWDPAAARAVAAWMAPETRLWNDTVEVNVAYGAAAGADSGADRIARAEAAGVAARLGRRAQGRLGQDGGALSDGEAARVRLARAFGRPEAPLVVLDEPFRGLERARRTRLLAAVRAQWAHATLLMACHDIADTVDLDLVVVLDGGRIVETGSPQVLRGTPGSLYAALLAADRSGLGGGWLTCTLGGTG